MKRWGVSNGFHCDLFGKNAGDVANFLFKICKMGQNDVGQIDETVGQ